MKKSMYLAVLFICLGTFSAMAITPKKVTLPDGTVIIVGKVDIPTQG